MAFDVTIHALLPARKPDERCMQLLTAYDSCCTIRNDDDDDDDDTVNVKASAKGTT